MFLNPYACFLHCLVTSLTQFLDKLAVFLFVGPMGPLSYVFQLEPATSMVWKSYFTPWCVFSSTHQLKVAPQIFSPLLWLPATRWWTSPWWWRNPCWWTTANGIDVRNDQGDAAEPSWTCWILKIAERSQRQQGRPPKQEWQPQPWREGVSQQERHTVCHHVWCGRLTQTRKRKAPEGA